MDNEKEAHHADVRRDRPASSASAAAGGCNEEVNLHAAPQSLLNRDKDPAFERATKLYRDDHPYGRLLIKPQAGFSGRQSYTHVLGLKVRDMLRYHCGWRRFTCMVIIAFASGLSGVCFAQTGDTRQELVEAYRAAYRDLLGEPLDLDNLFRFDGAGRREGNMESGSVDT